MSDVLQRGTRGCLGSEEFCLSGVFSVARFFVGMCRPAAYSFMQENQDNGDLGLLRQ